MVGRKFLPSQTFSHPNSQPGDPAELWVFRESPTALLTASVCARALPALVGSVLSYRSSFIQKHPELEAVEYVGTALQL